MRLRQFFQLWVFPFISFVIFIAALKMLSEVNVRVEEYQSWYRKRSGLDTVFQENNSNVEFSNNLIERMGNVTDSLQTDPQRNCRHSNSTKSNIR